eukprot:607843-Amphidinium_carterae.1
MISAGTVMKFRQHGKALVATPPAILKRYPAQAIGEETQMAHVDDAKKEVKTLNTLSSIAHTGILRNRCWRTAPASPSFGRMAQENTVVVLTSEDVGLVTTLVVCTVQALQSGRRQPKGRHWDLEERAKAALHPWMRVRWMKAHQTQADVDHGRVTADDLFGKLVGPKLKDRPNSEPRVRLPPEGPVEGPELEVGGQCLDCGKSVVLSTKEKQAAYCWFFSAGGQEYRSPLRPTGSFSIRTQFQGGTGSAL